MFVHCPGVKGMDERCGHVALGLELSFDAFRISVVHGFPAFMEMVYGHFH